MIKIRLIPVLLLKNGSLVRSQEFVSHTIIGDPFHEVERFNQWNVDELIYLIIDDDEENKGKKIDTYSRGIYIHGTSEEGSLGNPSSHGCVRMNNSDIIYLFDRIEEGTLVVLIDN